MTQPKLIPALNLEKDNKRSFTEQELRAPMAVEDEVAHKKLRNA
jgi:hypothetical protein